MFKEHKDKFQTYNGYRIKVVYIHGTKKYQANISSLSDRVEYLFERTIEENSPDANNAFKKAKKKIDEHSWQLILEKDISKLYIRQCFDDFWEYKVENGEMFQEKKETKEEVIFCGTSIIENYWQKVLTYFGTNIYICINQSNMYMCRIDRQILEQEFDDPLSAISIGIKTADSQLKN